MNLSPSTLTAYIQEVFSEKYPLLKIKFYTRTHKEFEGSRITEEVMENITLNELNSSILTGDIGISKSVTAKQLESEFENKYGLHVQVFRKSGDTWLQTSKTDHWTLEKHQQKAQESE